MTSSTHPAIVWFRDDLRLSDQPALRAAIETGAPVLCVYVFDETSDGVRPLGGASRWWLHHSLRSLAEELENIGGRLDLLRGPGAEAIVALARAAKAEGVFWTRRYGAAEIGVDRAAKAALLEAGVEVRSFNGQLLREPWDVQTKTGDFYKVYTPFWRAAQALGDVAQPSPRPRRLSGARWPRSAPERIALEDLRLPPIAPDWAGGLRETWTPGEPAARTRLAEFLDRAKGYSHSRDRPDQNGTSGLSPHLRFGEITPRQIWHATRHAVAGSTAPAQDAEKFLTEIGWREFSYHLLFHVPDLRTRNFQSKFDAFPWRQPSPGELHAWRRGLTGYPIVDAGMRQLWTTGVMHNRVRMIAASFLVKDLLADWRLGEEWFWDTLVDADPANNPASWQWIAGSGADAAPYFRVFNPVLQGKKFDPDGAYVRRFIPELARLPGRWIHEPWAAGSEQLREAGVTLGETYPNRVVDHGRARDRALAALASARPDTA